ncbi:NAD(P)/FAD-dependent oxidoreductase [Pedobacter miscanthi]|uniref:NAD(P)/FAD-dependent oxidoreductase n=1 Tax=Pedobacter miscanthi TaxID=2259170 RepID=UPI00292EFCC2|nr:FAD-dependent oxidoreductase [Pedobacter miscanthi]
MRTATEHIRCLIIGSGPAGYTAAIYAARAGLHPVMYAERSSCGQILPTMDTEKIPVYPDGITGNEMMEDYHRQAIRFGTDVRSGFLRDVNFNSYPYQICTEDGRELLTETIIISTSVSNKWLGLESEERYKGFGVSGCAACDGFFFRGQNVAVIGAGEIAVEEALSLSRSVSKVYMLVCQNEIQASGSFINRLLSAPNIEIMYNTEILEILGDGLKVTGVKIFYKKTRKEMGIPVSGIFIAIGNQPNTELFREVLHMNESGYIKTVKGSTSTAIEGVFCCGDAQYPYNWGALTASGTGGLAALDAERFLKEREAQDILRQRSQLI